MLIRGDHRRRTRVHDESGTLALSSFADVRDSLVALSTALIRVITGYRFPYPWLALSAVRFMKSRLSKDSNAFEWGTGMSSAWYGKRFARVHGVEDSRAWFDTMHGRVGNAQIAFREGDSYVDFIRSFPEAYFDLIVIDGSYRDKCIEIAPTYLKKDGLLVIDDTDKDYLDNGVMRRVRDQLTRLSGFEIVKCSGWALGVFFAKETTVCIRSGDSIESVGQ